MKAKYNGIEYDLKFITYLKVQLLKLILIAIRLIRGILRLTKSLLPVIPVMLFWALFIWLLSYHNQVPEQNFLFYLKEAKYSIFTSVILVSVTNIISTFKKHKKILREQYYYYYNLMDYSDNFVELISKNINSDVEIFKYSFFTIDRHYKIRKILENEIIHQFENSNEIISTLDLISNYIRDIELASKNQALETKNDIATCIRWCKDALSKFRTTVINNEPDNDKTKWLVIHLYDLIEHIRYPWRRDEKIDSLIKNIIADDLGYIEINTTLRLFVDKDYIGD